MAEHIYLGCQLENVQSRTFLNECDYYDIVLLPLQNVILLPGETVHLRIRSRSYIRIVRSIMNGNGKYINHLDGNGNGNGIVNLHGYADIVGTVGTTSEISRHQQQSVEAHWGKGPITLRGCNSYTTENTANSTKSTRTTIR